MLWVYASKLMICTSKLTHSLEFCASHCLCVQGRKNAPWIHLWNPSYSHTFVWLSIGHRLADINRYQLTNVYRLTSIDRLDFRWSIFIDLTPQDREHSFLKGDSFNQKCVRQMPVGPAWLHDSFVCFLWNCNYIVTFCMWWELILYSKETNPCLCNPKAQGNYVYLTHSLEQASIVLSQSVS